MSDAATALLRALGLAKPAMPATVEEIRSRHWASATFAGTRHHLVFSLNGEDAEAAADALLEGIEEREFDLRNHFLADIRIVSRTSTGSAIRITLEALTLEAS